MNITVFMTEKCSYIPNGKETYTNVTDLEYEVNYGLRFQADCFMSKTNRKVYLFKTSEISKFIMNDEIIK